MSAKAISEYSGKELLYRHMEQLDSVMRPDAVKLTANDDFDDVTKYAEWLHKDNVSLMLYCYKKR